MGPLYIDFAQRLELALQNLRTWATATPTEWNVHYAVDGLEPTTSPDTFGKSRLFLFDAQYLSAYKEQLQVRFTDNERREEELRKLQEFTESLLEGKTVAAINVQARDIEAARGMALKELRVTLDVINFYSDIIHRPKTAYASVYPEDEVGIQRVAIPVLVPGIPLQLDQQQKPFGRNQLFSMPKLVHSAGGELGVARISAILASITPTAMERRLLAAVQWAGRATVDDRNEEAFLLYAIALECLIMERESDAELTYRLRMRMAHLLAQTIEERRRVVKDISGLYGIRSAIVHRGEYIVAQADLDLMRYYTKSAIVKVLTEEPFLSMTTDNDLRSWFDEQLLR